MSASRAFVTFAGRIDTPSTLGSTARRAAQHAGVLGHKPHCATVCYMSESERAPARVGVRELRQNLSVYLARVKAGETLDVTEHGQPVAQLGPRPVKPISIIDQMIADGRATAATFDHRKIGPPTIRATPGEPTPSEILQAMRDEEYR